MAIGAGARVILISPTGERMEYTIRLHFWATNKVTEYEALIHGLRIASEFGARCLFVRGNSELVVSRVMKEVSCHDSKMAAYCSEVWKLKERFDGLELHHILRRDNLAADSLAKIASSRGPTPLGVFINGAHKQLTGTAGKAEPTQAVEHHHDLEATSPTDIMMIGRAVADTRTDWTAPFIEFLAWGNLLDDPTEARCLARCCKSYMIIGDVLYKHSTSGILQRCIPGRRCNNSCRKLTWESADITQCPEHWLGRSFNKAFIGSQWLLTLSKSCEAMRDVRMTNALTYIGATNHTVNVALHDLGAQPAQAIQEGALGLHPSAGDNRQVHQVDRCEAHSGSKIQRRV
jgi:ribonuclease HI